MVLSFETRIDGEKFYKLLCALGASPERKGNEFTVYTGDYNDALEDFKIWNSQLRSVMEKEWQKNIEKAVMCWGKSADVLIDWMTATYLIHKRDCPLMKFSIN